MMHGASAEGERTTAYDSSHEDYYQQIYTNGKHSGLATLFHVLPTCTFAQIQESEDFVTVCSSLVGSGFNRMSSFRLN